MPEPMMNTEQTVSAEGTRVVTADGIYEFDLLDPRNKVSEETLNSLFMEIKKRKDVAKKRYDMNEEELMTIATYMKPRDSDYNLDGGITYGENKIGRLYDHTAINTLSDITNKAFMTLIPKNSKWFGIRLQDHVEADQMELQKWLNKEASKLKSVLGTSNFKPAITEAMYYFYAFGYCGIRINPNYYTGKLSFENCPVNATMLEGAPNNDIREGGIILMSEYTRNEWNRMYPQHAEEGDNDTKIEVVYGTVPLRFDTDLKKMIWLQFSFRKGRSNFLTAKEITQERNRFIVGGFAPSKGHWYPEGLGHRMLPDAQSLNLMQSDYMKIVAYTSNPMFTADAQADIPANFEPSPGALLITNQGGVGDPNAGLKPLVVTQNQGPILTAIQTKQEQIRETMNLLPTLQQAPTFKTATEWTLHKEKENESTGPLIDKFKEQVLIPLLERCAWFCRDMKILDEGFKADGSIYYQFEVVGSEERKDKLARLQTNAAMWEQLGPILQMNPEAVMLNLDEEEYIKDVFMALDKENLVRSKEEKMAMKERIAQAKKQVTENQ